MRQNIKWFRREDIATLGCFIKTAYFPSTTDLSFFSMLLPKCLLNFSLLNKILTCYILYLSPSFFKFKQWLKAL